MKIKKLYIAIVALALSAGMTSCNDYLDKQPDSRLDLQSPTDVSKLLVNAYPQVHPAYLLEMYSDNTDCNLNTGWDAASRFQQQAYEWDDITETSDYDTLLLTGQPTMMPSPQPISLWNTSTVRQTRALILLRRVRLSCAVPMPCSSWLTYSAWLTTRPQQPQTWVFLTQRWLKPMYT